VKRAGVKRGATLKTEYRRDVFAATSDPQRAGSTVKYNMGEPGVTRRETFQSHRDAFSPLPPVRRDRHPANTGSSPQ